MPGVTTLTPKVGISTVAKKKPPADDQSGGSRPINFRAPPDLATRLDRVAEGLGLDVSNLVRMVLYENLAAYERRVRELDQGKSTT